MQTSHSQSPSASCPSPHLSSFTSLSRSRPYSTVHSSAMGAKAGGPLPAPRPSPPIPEPHPPGSAAAPSPLSSGSPQPPSLEWAKRPRETPQRAPVAAAAIFEAGRHYKYTHRRHLGSGPGATGGALTQKPRPFLPRVTRDGRGRAEAAGRAQRGGKGPAEGSEAAVARAAW